MTVREMSKHMLRERLNGDLAAELAAIIQYITYAAKTSGPQRPELSSFFLKEVAEEQKHAQFLADKIVALGGEPTTRPADISTPTSNRDLLQAILAAETDAVTRYTERVKDAETFGDKGLAVRLEEMVRDEAGHRQETERILADWPE